MLSWGAVGGERGGREGEWILTVFPCTAHITSLTTFSPLFCFVFVFFLLFVFLRNTSSSSPRYKNNNYFLNGYREVWLERAFKASSFDHLFSLLTVKWHHGPNASSLQPPLYPLHPPGCGPIFCLATRCFSTDDSDWSASTRTKKNTNEINWFRRPFWIPGKNVKAAVFNTVKPTGRTGLRVVRRYEIVLDIRWFIQLSHCLSWTGLACSTVLMLVVHVGIKLK